MGGSHHSNDVKAEILIDIILGRRQYRILIVLLDAYDLCRNSLLLLVVHDNNCAGHDVIALPFLLSHVLFYQEADGLRAVGKAILVHILIQRFQQVVFQRDAKTFYRT